MRPGPAGGVHHAPADGPDLRELQGEDDQPREVHLPDQPAGPQRDALLPPGPRAHRRDDADRLHAGGRRGVPEVPPHLPARPRPLHRLRGPAPHRGDPPERRDPPPLGDRGDGRRADPRPRRPGRGRHGHPHRQALPLHPVRRDLALQHAADHARRGDEQPGAAERPAVPRHAPRARARGGVPGVRRRVRGRRAEGLPPRGAAVGGLPQGERALPARPLPRPALHLQRRHPGHGGGRPRRDVRRPAHHRPEDARPAGGLRRRRGLGPGDLRAPGGGADGGRPQPARRRIVASGRPTATAS